MAWRVAKSLLQLRKQVDVLWPKRSIASDGTIGNEEHSARLSDHNPDEDGVVKAIDLTHDPLNGLDSENLAKALLQSRDVRIKYIISNAKIVSGPAGPAAWVWRAYGGKNPHNHHVHLSVRAEAKYYDDVRPWVLGAVLPPPAPSKEKPHIVPFEVLKLGMENPRVIELQRKLGLWDDGYFGPATEAAVKARQKELGIVADGVVGAHTWEKL